MNKENVQRLIDEGKTKGEIAESIGVMVKTLDMFLNAHELSVNDAVESADDSVNSKSHAKQETPQVKPKKQKGKGAYIHVDSDEVVRLYVEAKLLQREIAVIFGVSRQKIAQVLRNEGINTRKRESDMKATRQEVWNMYNKEGMTRQEIADHFKVNLQVVDKFMQRERIVLGNRYGRPKKQHKGHDPKKFESTLRKYRDLDAVAKHYGVKKTTIYYYIDKFELRDRWQDIKKGEQVNV